MSTINSYTLLVGILAAIAAIGLGGIITSQAVYAQGGATPQQELNTFLTTIASIITTTAALAGGIIATFARMSQKLGTARDDQIEKMWAIAQELQSSDTWSKQLDERLVAIGEVISALPGGRELLEQKRVDLRRWNDEASRLDDEISKIYASMRPLLFKKK
jgi:hypothetical protein